MVYLLYNKLLLRVLVALTGLGIGLCAYNYITLSVQKLPEGGQGLRDSLAIVSFLIAGFLVMLIAEVVDNHYIRVFGGLCAALGAVISYPWIFRADGPMLLKLPGGPGGMSQAGLGFGGAVACVALMMALLIWRLVLDRITYGRRPPAVARADIKLGSAPQGAGAAPAEPELAAIPIDRSPLLLSASQLAAVGPPVAAPAPRQAGPVKRLTGIGGLYLGSEFELTPGEHILGRQESDLLLSNDNQVSRRHASIKVDSASLATLADLGSTNGTFVNNERITSLALAPGDVIRIGTSLFRVD